MAKVRINGEYFEWDRTRKPISEAIAVERALKDYFGNYQQWQDGLTAGSAVAYAGLVWLIWRRNGRDVPIGDLLDGKVDFDQNEVEFEPDEGETDPTVLPPEASSSTGGGTSPPSASSASARGKSAASK